MVPVAMADHVEKNGLEGQLKYNLFVGASSGAETENRWARLNMIERRSPHQVGKEIAKGINNGQIKFFDKHLSMFPSDLVYVSPSRVFPPRRITKSNLFPLGLVHAEQAGAKNRCGCYRGVSNH